MLDLGATEAVLALCLGLIPLVLSQVQRLNLGGEILLSLGRAIVQLIVLAYVLSLAFSQPAPWATFAVLGLLGLITTRLLSQRISPDLPGLTVWVAAALLTSLGTVLSYAVLVVIRPDAWFDPQYWIPLGSALLAQCLNGGAIAGDQLLRLLQRHRADIETRLSLGATPGQAVQTYRQAALRTALLPNLNTLAIAGLGNIPLFMNGQLIAGANPLVAVLYELLLGLVLLSGGAIAASLICWGIERLSFTAQAQLKEI